MMNVTGALADLTATQTTERYARKIHRVRGRVLRVMTYVITHTNPSNPWKPRGGQGT